MKIKSILFDHDGTLVDSEVTHFKLWKNILKQYQIDLAEQGYKDFHSGTPTPKNAEILVEKYSMAITAKMLAIEKESATHEFLAKNTFPLMPEARETIKTFFDKGLSLGVVTGAGKYGVTSTLKGHQLEQYFSVITTGEDVEQSKPNPAVYLLALERLGIKPDECIAIEDTENGIRSAIAAGLVCCAVKSDYSAGHDLSIATKTFDSMNEAKNWIIRNFS